ncbi:hypothetical protein SprV_0301047700 [Sparganum proliferum]
MCVEVNESFCCSVSGRWHVPPPDYAPPRSKRRLLCRLSPCRQISQLAANCVPSSPPPGLIHRPYREEGEREGGRKGNGVHSDVGAPSDLLLLIASFHRTAVFIFAGILRVLNSLNCSKPELT